MQRKDLEITDDLLSQKDIEELLIDFPAPPLQPPSPLVAILPFTAEQKAALEVAERKFKISPEAFYDHLRWLANEGFNSEQVVEIVSWYGKGLVETLIETSDELKQLEFNKDHIFTMIKAKSSLALKFVKTHFYALKNLNLTPDLLLEILLKNPIDYLTDTAFSMRRFQLHGSKKNEDKKAKPEMDQQQEHLNNVNIARPFVAEMNFTPTTLTTFVTNLKHPANLDSFKRNCNPLMTFGFSNQHLKDIVCSSDIKTTGFLLDILRDITPVLQDLEFSVEQITTLARDPKSLKILNSLKLCSSELKSLGLKSPQILELLQLTDGAFNIDVIKSNYFSFFSIHSKRGTDGVMNLLKAAAVASDFETSPEKRRRLGLH